MKNIFNSIHQLHFNQNPLGMGNQGGSGASLAHTEFILAFFWQLQLSTVLPQMFNSDPRQENSPLT